VFVIPKEAPTNDYGFVMIPVDPLKQLRYGLCLMCGESCRPDRHHAYWPGPARTAQVAAERKRDSKFNRLPDYRVDLYRKLRDSPFSLSKPLCRNWHNSLHTLQRPPRELPDKLIIEAALDQYDRIDRAAAKSRVVATLLRHQPENLAKLEYEESILSALVGDLPSEVLFPTIGYYCLHEDLDPSSFHDAPSTFHLPKVTKRITNILTSVQEALS
jgi:hypothetical protein